MGDRANQRITIPGLPDDFAKVVAGLQGRVLDENRSLVSTEVEKETLLISPAVLHKQKVDFHTSLKLGHLVEGKGIYIGGWQPVSKGGTNLKKIFDIYAAPEDWWLPKSYDKAVETIGEVNDWHGHDGAQGMVDDTKILEAIQTGNEKILEKWFIPPLEILAGSTGADGKAIINSHNMYKLSQTEKWEHTFVTDNEDQYTLFPYYWSSTRIGDGVNRRMRVVDFSSGDIIDLIPGNSLQFRPVRAELRPE